MKYFFSGALIFCTLSWTASASNLKQFFSSEGKNLYLYDGNDIKLGPIISYGASAGSSSSLDLTFLNSQGFPQVVSLVNSSNSDTDRQYVLTGLATIGFDLYFTTTNCTGTVYAASSAPPGCITGSTYCALPEVNGGAYFRTQSTGSTVTVASRFNGPSKTCTAYNYTGTFYITSNPSHSVCGPKLCKIKQE